MPVVCSDTIPVGRTDAGSCVTVCINSVTLVSGDTHEIEVRIAKVDKFGGGFYPTIEAAVTLDGTTVWNTSQTVYDPLTTYTFQTDITAGDHDICVDITNRDYVESSQFVC